MQQGRPWQAAVMESHTKRIEAASAKRDADWVDYQSAGFPTSWRDVLATKWQKTDDKRAANLEHLTACRSLRAAYRAGVQPDANDQEICDEAKKLARDTDRRLNSVDLEARTSLIEQTAEVRERLLMLGRMAQAAHICEQRGVLEKFTLHCERSIPGALRRVVCERWWRLALRRIHARSTEDVARQIGLVNKGRGCYASDDAVRRRKAQNTRNAAVLDSMAAINEDGQQYTLAELAAKGTANKAIRRAELMTRIAGFELIARECDHVAYFVTLTCPARMHAFRTSRTNRNRAEPNPAHDGTRVRDAQAHLTGQWAKFRAAAARAGLDLYGFRIAEPNHDATPHWHAIFFMPVHTTREKLSYRVMVRLLRKYFYWQASPDEQGARQHRIKVERIDWSRGSAAGYVAKYISKNIDGHRVEKDLYGNDALTSSQRVEAWAATYGIRQFQQIGGAPVGVWREVRRLNAEQARTSETVAQAIAAANIAALPMELGIGDDITAAHGWHHYTELQGGATVKRKNLRVRLLREDHGVIGRYGEPIGPQVAGVQVEDVERIETPSFGAVKKMTHIRRITKQVESERSTWRIVPMVAAEATVAQVLAVGQGAAAQPWSPVNNCTQRSAPQPLFAPSVQRFKKIGRVSTWVRGRKTKDIHHDTERIHH